MTQSYYSHIFSITEMIKTNN